MNRKISKLLIPNPTFNRTFNDVLKIGFGIILLSFIALSLTSCGRSGALYLEDETTKTQEDKS